MSALATKHEYEPHPLSKIFPPMDAEELDRLATDIQANGLKEAIWLFESKILEGNNRYRACLKIGRPLKEDAFRQFDPKTQGDALTFVISANLHRRHLNESQRASVAADLVTTKLGFNQYNSPSTTTEKAAKLLGVSEATVKTAKQVAEKAAPEIMELVRNGGLRLGAAKQLLEVPKEQQVAELTKAKAAAAAEKAAKAAAKTATPKAPKSPPVPKANQAMIDLDDFKAKWRGFDEMQRKAFVMSFEEDLAELLEYVRQQKAMIGVAA